MLGEISFCYPGVLYRRQQHARGALWPSRVLPRLGSRPLRCGPLGRRRKLAGECWHSADVHPTHSTSQISSVTGAYMTHVSCQGFRDEHADGIYPHNDWQNPFSNQSALYKMSDGSDCRINEFRRIGHAGCVQMILQGTEGCFEQSVSGSRWLTKDHAQQENLDQLLACTGQPRQPDDPMNKVTAADGTRSSACPMATRARISSSSMTSSQPVPAASFRATMLGTRRATFSHRYVLRPLPHSA